MCRCTNRLAEPEVWFRVVHLGQDGQKGTPVAYYREQSVEIALGPKGAFESGNIGSLRLRAPPSRVVSPVPPGKPAKVPKTPRVVELLRKAIEWRQQLDAGEVRNQADIAQREGITRARVTQIMGMLRLAPEIQARILSLPDAINRPPVTERTLRPIRTIVNPHEQFQEFQEIFI